MFTEKDIDQITRELIDPTKYFIVKIKINTGNKIFIAIDGFLNITIDKCAQLSQKLYEKLQTIDDDFELEVSSPGITSPFEVIEQYKKYKNSEVEVLMKNGQKLTGILGTTFENGFNLTIEEKIKDLKTRKKTTILKDIFIEFNDIKQTRRKIKF